MNRALQVAAAIGMAIVLSPSMSATAEPNFPSKQIHVIVPFSAAGVTDIVARVVFDKVSINTGQLAIIENRVGAGGALGMESVARAPADGYTIVLGDPAGSAAANVALYPKVSLDPQKDLVAIALLGITPAVLVVPSERPVGTFAEFLAYSKAHKTDLMYGSVGAGTPGHLNVELLKQRVHVDGTHVPYRSISQGISDLISNRLAYWIPPLPTALPHIRSGKLRAIAVSGDTRSADLPDVPTFTELGIKDFDVSSTYALFAPAGTPKAVVAKLYAELKVALADENVVSRLKMAGVEPKLAPADAVDALLGKSITQWASVIKSAGIELDKK